MCKNLLIYRSLLSTEGACIIGFIGMKAYYIEEVLQTSKVLIIPFISILIFGTSNLRSLDSKRVNGNLNQEVFNERYLYGPKK